MNLAWRLGSTAETGKIQTDEATHQRLKHIYQFQEKQQIVTGFPTYWLEKRSALFDA